MFTDVNRWSSVFPSSLAAPERGGSALHFSRLRSVYRSSPSTLTFSLPFTRNGNFLIRPRTRLHVQRLVAQLDPEERYSPADRLRLWREGINGECFIRRSPQTGAWSGLSWRACPGMSCGLSALPELELCGSCVKPEAATLVTQSGDINGTFTNHNV